MEKLILPLKEAIEAAAKQNFERDVRKGLLTQKFWEGSKNIYWSAAEEQFLSKGKNFQPVYPDHPLILAEEMQPVCLDSKCEVKPVITPASEEGEPPLFKKGTDNRIANANWIKWYQETKGVSLQTAFEEFKRRASKHHGTIVL